MGRDKAWLVVAAIAVVGVLLRAGSLGEFWLNGDEGLYDFIAHAPYELARVPIAHNAHPPGYFWLLRGVAWFGDDFVAAITDFPDFEHLEAKGRTEG